MNVSKYTQESRSKHCHDISNQFSYVHWLASTFYFEKSRLLQQNWKELSDLKNISFQLLVTSLIHCLLKNWHCDNHRIQQQKIGPKFKDKVHATFLGRCGSHCVGEHYYKKRNGQKDRDSRPRLPALFYQRPYSNLSLILSGYNLPWYHPIPCPTISKFNISTDFCTNPKSGWDPPTTTAVAEPPFLNNPQECPYLG